MKKYFYILIIAITLNSCYKEEMVYPGDNLPDWSSITHSNSAPANYDLVFDQTKVQRIDIVISSSNWSTMQSDLESVTGDSGGAPGGRPGGGMPNQDAESSDESPIYIPCDLFYNNTQWYYVGIRYKGNSSLSSAISSGIEKLPLRLEFNHFEDDYPNIMGQSFYGFQQLSLSNNFDDLSQIRDKAATDLFREFGVPAPYSAFYEIYIDYGDGPIYFGLYTVNEVVFDTVLEKQFGSNTGNCYKPENTGAKFLENSFSTLDFEKKTNKSSSWDDIKEMYNILHSNTRLNNSTQWQQDFESVFDVYGFLKYLAVNSVIQNWDVYGNMPHNYYLYHDPKDDLIKWIPWDNNEAFQDGKMTNYDLAYSTINANEWPLIPYILGQEKYELAYKNYINDFVNGAFAPSKMKIQYANYQSLIEPYVYAEKAPYTFLNNSSSFNTAINQLITHCSMRHNIATNYLGK